MKNNIIRILWLLYFAINFFLFTSIYVDAYIDPSVMTYTIQAVTGVAIAIGAFVGIYWRKAKKKINQKLNIDENKGKEVESDDIVVKKKKNNKK